MVSLTERDGFALTSCEALAAFAGALDLRVVEFRTATAADVESSWAKRLGIPRRREARVLVAQKR
jgi:hypothetical protein